MSQLEPIYLAIGRRITTERRKRGWNQDRLAAECGMTRASFANIEAGRQRVQIHALERLAAVFGVSMADLLTEPKREPRDLEEGFPDWISADGKAAILAMVRDWRETR